LAAGRVDAVHHQVEKQDLRLADPQFVLEAHSGTDVVEDVDNAVDRMIR